MSRLFWGTGVLLRFLSKWGGPSLGSSISTAWHSQNNKIDSRNGGSTGWQDETEKKGRKWRGDRENDHSAGQWLVQIKSKLLLEFCRWYLHWWAVHASCLYVLCVWEREEFAAIQLIGTERTSKSVCACACTSVCVVVGGCVCGFTRVCMYVRVRERVCKCPYVWGSEPLVEILHDSWKGNKGKFFLCFSCKGLQREKRWMDLLQMPPRVH